MLHATKTKTPKNIDKQLKYWNVKSAGEYSSGEKVWGGGIANGGWKESKRIRRGCRVIHILIHIDCDASSYMYSLCLEMRCLSLFSKLRGCLGVVRFLSVRSVATLYKHLIIFGFSRDSHRNIVTISPLLRPIALSLACHVCHLCVTLATYTISSGWGICLSRFWFLSRSTRTHAQTVRQMDLADDPGRFGQDGFSVWMLSQTASHNYTCPCLSDCSWDGVLGFSLGWELRHGHVTTRVRVQLHSH